MIAQLPLSCRVIPALYTIQSRQISIAADSQYLTQLGATSIHSSKGYWVQGTIWQKAMHTAHAQLRSMVTPRTNRQTGILGWAGLGSQLGYFGCHCCQVN